jgi:hypothetical protein
MRGLPPAGGSPLIMEGGSKTANTVISSNSHLIPVQPIINYPASKVKNKTMI